MILVKILYDSNHLFKNCRQTKRNQIKLPPVSMNVEFKPLDLAWTSTTLYFTEQQIRNEGTTVYANKTIYDSRLTKQPTRY